jgi:sugar O-acyltransferase (sialic acid O-acetyltransferase NeuD family)
MDEGMLRELIIVCAGSFASELASYVRDLQVVGEPVIVRGFVDDHRFESTYEGAPLLGRIEQLRSFLDAHSDSQFSYLSAVGDNWTRRDVVQRVERLRAANLVPWSARHPKAIVGDSVEVGAGVCLAPGAIVTAHVTIGDHCIVNINSSVSHGSVLESFVHVGPSASICGGVTLGEGCCVGAGATVVDDVQVGAWSIIGAGAVVTDDVPAHVTVMGTPARIVQRHRRGMRQPRLAG